jgi:hypothetical protein
MPSAVAQPQIPAIVCQGSGRASGARWKLARDDPFGDWLHAGQGAGDDVQGAPVRVADMFGLWDVGGRRLAEADRVVIWPVDDGVKRLAQPPFTRTTQLLTDAAAR